MSKTYQMKISNIIPPECFMKTSPNRKSIEEIKEEIRKTGKQQKPVTINGNRTIIDGYKQYVAMKEMGYEYVDIKYGKTKKPVEPAKRIKHLYIYGHHKQSNSINPIEYVWKFSLKSGELKDWKEKYGKKKSAVVMTKTGESEIVITDVQMWLKNEYKSTLTGKTIKNILRFC